MFEFETAKTMLTRRALFSRTANGLGAAALASLEARSGIAAPAAADPASPGNAKAGLPNLPHHQPQARRAIYLFMSGAPSQMDLWDYKPTMADWFDKDLPDSIRQGQRLTTMTSGQQRFPVAPSIYKFDKHGD